MKTKTKKKTAKKKKMILKEYVIQKIEHSENISDRYAAFERQEFSDGSERFLRITQVSWSLDQERVEEELSRYLSFGKKPERFSIVSKFDARGNKKLAAFE